MTDELRGALVAELRRQNPDASLHDHGNTIHLSGGVTPQSSGCDIDLEELVDAIRQALSAPVGDGRLGPAALHAAHDDHGKPARVAALRERAQMVRRWQSAPSWQDIDALLAWVDALSQPSPDGGGLAFTDADGVEWFERTFGVPIGDMPSRLDVERIKDALLPAALPPLASGEEKGRRADKDALTEPFASPGDASPAQRLPG